MSHFHERKEKTCLNCTTQVVGRFCHVCGQENVEPKETFWHLTRHFFEDLTHFDGKFFSTIKYLLSRPGFLTLEYIRGRRAAYLNPIRMYLFISAVFFLILMSFFLPQSAKVKVKEGKTPQTSRATTSNKSSVIHSIRSFLDSADHTLKEADYSDSLDRALDNAPMPRSFREYDSIQKSLPEDRRDGAVSRYMSKKIIAVYEMDKEHPGEVSHRLRERFFHSMPYMLFLSVPLIALLLRLLYVRRKQHYFVAHVIFIIHYYCAFFILYLAVLILSEAGSWGIYAAIVPFAAIFFYLYFAMRRFYQQGWGKTLVKFVLLSMFGSTIIGVLTLLFIFRSFIGLTP